jgi:hypothetical protein
MNSNLRAKIAANAPQRAQDPKRADQFSRVVCAREEWNSDAAIPSPYTRSVAVGDLVDGVARSTRRYDRRVSAAAVPRGLCRTAAVDPYLRFETNAAHLFFQLVSRRYERGSLLLTSNRSVGEWGTVFGEPRASWCLLF